MRDAGFYVVDSVSPLWRLHVAARADAAMVRKAVRCTRAFVEVGEFFMAMLRVRTRNAAA